MNCTIPPQGMTEATDPPFFGRLLERSLGMVFKTRLTLGCEARNSTW